MVGRCSPSRVRARQDLRVSSATIRSKPTKQCLIAHGTASLSAAATGSCGRERELDSWSPTKTSTTTCRHSWTRTVSSCRCTSSSELCANGRTRVILCRDMRSRLWRFLVLVILLASGVVAAWSGWKASQLILQLDRSQLDLSDRIDQLLATLDTVTTAQQTYVTPSPQLDPSRVSELINRIRSESEGLRSRLPSTE